MPIYEFETVLGEPREVFFWMATVCEIGQTIEHGGERLTRVPSRENRGIVREYAHVSRSLPRVDPKNPYWHRFDSQNRPAFTSKAEVERLTSQLRGEHASGFKYD